MTKNSYKTSELISPEEAEEANLNVFYWNKRKTKEMTAAQEIRKEQQLAYNKAAQEESKRLTRISQLALQDTFNRIKT